MLFPLMSTFSNISSRAYIFFVILALCTLLRSQKYNVITLIAQKLLTTLLVHRTHRFPALISAAVKETIEHVLQTRSVTAPVTLRPTLVVAAQIALGYLHPAHTSGCQVSRLPETLIL